MKPYMMIREMNGSERKVVKKKKYNLYQSKSAIVYLFEQENKTPL